jgi:iron(III) transport system substrate-binding protein
MYSNGAWRATVATLLLLVACAPPQPPPVSPASQPAAAAATPEEQEWARVVEAAKREGRVVVAGHPTPEAEQAATEPFVRQYGITVQYEPIGGPRGPQLVERIRTERAANQYLWDVGILGTTTIITAMKPMGVLEPIEPALLLPEVKDSSRWRLGLDYTDKDRLGLIMTPYASLAFMINTQQARPEQFRSYKDLLDPQWKGKIVMHDPRIAGSGQAVTSFYFAHKDLGEPFVRALARQEPVVLRDIRQEIDLVAQGKASICLGCDPTTGSAMIEKGVPLAFVSPRQMVEGGYLSSGPGAVVLFNQAPHPNAAKVYLNWLLSKDGQQSVAKALAFPSGRLDVSNDWAEPWMAVDPTYWPSHTEDSVLFARAALPPVLKELYGE